VKGFSETVISFLRRSFAARVVLDDESWVQFEDREALLYGEPDGRTMWIAIYPQRERLRCKLLYTRDIRGWQSPHEMDGVSEEKKAEILRKIGVLFNRKNYQHEIRSS
jgi:hypothetical protein